MPPIPLRREDVTALYQGRYWHSGTGPKGSDCVDLDGTLVRKNDLDALFSERLLFDWRGETFIFSSAKDGHVSGSWSHAYSDERARELGLDGDPWMGWGGTFPESEIDNVRIDHYDILAAWRHEKEVGVSPSPELYSYLRPATIEEWLHGEWPPTPPDRG